MARQLTTRHSKKTLRQQGFTLIELMVVTAIAGVLGGVAVPRFLSAMDIADAKAKTAAAVGMAKECQSWVQTRGDGMEEGPDLTKSVTGTCNEDTGGTILSAAFRKALPAGYDGLQCIDDTSSGGEVQASIAIDRSGQAVCTLI